MNIRSVLFGSLVLYGFASKAQVKINIPVDEVSRVERTLASDEMQGRRAFTPGIDKAADFIASEFRKAGIMPVEGNSYFQEFNMNRYRFVSVAATIEGKEVDPARVAVFTSQEELNVTEKDGYEIGVIAPTDTLYRAMRRFLGTGKNVVVLVDSSHARFFKNIKRPVRESMPDSGNVVFLLGVSKPSGFNIRNVQEVTAMKLRNVVGMIPGRSKMKEQVIFSAHYDHLGIQSPNSKQDSIYNGANDDASGTTAVIMLANYFKRLHQNERTLIFAAFTAEESGGFGSQYFSSKFDPANVVAMFNIEMIGTDSKWGKNSAYITGYDKTDMGKILEKNLQGTSFSFHPDPYPDQQLFYRSDNATLAKLGVPAHTISTSKMDNEPYYHTQEDEFETLDMNNMAEIIKAIALSSKSIVSGKDTPERVKEF